MKITDVTVSVRRELDVGFVPYMKEIYALAETRRCNPFGMQTTFGTKNNGKFEIFASQKAQLEEGEDAQGAVRQLINILDAEVLDALATAFPESFAVAETLGIDPDEFAYREVRTEAKNAPVEF